MSVTYEIRGDVAVLRMSNPPVNGLGIATRRGLVESLDRALDDDAVRAVVVTGDARAFSGGADIREFNKPEASQEPTLPTVIARFERSTKPLVAAIEGLALGGGLELALGMNARVADSAALIGLPEVKLGILPGAGGTQRFPRAAGLEVALNMIVSGEPVKAKRLAATRLFEKLVDSDTVGAAVEVARGMVGGSLPRVRDMRVEHPNPEGFLGFARGAVAAAAASYPAPLKCIDAIEAAVKRSFDEGILVEREAFAVLVNTPESKALRHVFFSDRAASKIPDVASDTPQREVRRVGVIGAGTMGGGITMNFLNAGIPVTLLETAQEPLDRGLGTIRRNYESSAKKGKLTAEQVEQRLGLLTPTLRYEDLADADLIIEAVFEDYAVKKAVFEKLDAVAKPGAILASNTSTLDVNRIAALTARPESVVGMHFFSPANIMKLLEVVRGSATAKDVLATVMAIAKKIGKTAVVSGVCDGFIGNRMIEQYGRQAGFLLEEGATPQQIDHAAESFGFAMGPFRMSDLAGNDIGWAIRKRRLVEQPDLIYSKTADLLCEMGRFGQKAGKGWYDYKPGDRKAYPSAEVEAMVAEYARGIGVPPRDIPDSEIVERLVYALVNEGARILEEGIAARASDIDVVYLYGYGFPVWRGGPMFHADSVGLFNVLASMRRFAKGHQGSDWEPAPLLVKLAAEGGSFNG
ncbi:MULTISPECIES: 3-hydroxyacyl-CoA dehydrogenase NAD-binding domain-containing protein [Luteibacter]|uniref:3-hydroxyacyl-CoA dehydrogenase NAD-binding domain-containing protein n=1 Tax=Luteibacter sp. dw_328 TaxID=2719796 RepID=UPI0007BEAB9A|nr:MULTISPECIES: 3-hydroxyacyl-CoA dehydrogenase NAD-binding domain-containing protein [Luteibacter]